MHEWETRGSGASDGAEAMMATKARVAQHKAILAALDAPGGRARTDADIAMQVGCGAMSVAYVRGHNPTAEEMEQKIRALDGVFPGIYQWWLETQEKKQTTEASE